MIIRYLLIHLSRNLHELIPLKVINRSKNLFCNVAQICNLVLEFNGLVSKGSVERLTFLLFKSCSVLFPCLYLVF